MKELEQLYDKYYKKLYGYCITLTRNKDAAEDLVEESFYRAVKNIDKFRGDSDIGVWLCSIAKNIFYTECTKKKKRLLYTPEPDAFGAMEDRENVKEILICMNRLEEPYRGVFFLRVFGQIKYSEIAQVYGKSENWAYVTYFRAKLKIIESLEG